MLENCEDIVICVYLIATDHYVGLYIHLYTQNGLLFSIFTNAFNIRGPSKTFPKRLGGYPVQKHTILHIIV